MMNRLLPTRATLLTLLVGLPVVLIDAPARATTGPAERYSQTSVVDTDPTKSVRVDCPGDLVVSGPGGRIDVSDGHVQLTGIVPAADLKSVTVFGWARG